MDGEGGAASLLISRSRTFAELEDTPEEKRSVACPSTAEAVACIKGRFPPLAWVRASSLATLRSDCIAGLTVGVMLIPQSMAYSMLAGLPPIYGLYSSTLPLLAFALFTSSKDVQVGPVATTAIMISSACTTVTTDEAEFPRLATTLSLLSAFVLLLMGVLQLGFVVNFLSRPVMSGFMTAAAFIIVASQLEELFGLSYARSPDFYVTIYYFFSNIASTQWSSLLMASICISILVVAKEMKCPRWFPIHFIIVMISIAISYTADLESTGMRIVGDIPSGLPPAAFPSTQDMGTLVAPAVLLSMISYMGTISLGKSFASRNNYECDANQELMASGLACLVGSFFTAFTVSGSFSRTALNSAAGAATPLAGMLTALLLLLLLLLLTSIFKYLPRNVLAGLIVTSVRSLMDFKEARRLYFLQMSDCLQWVVAFVGVLALGIQNGLLVSAAVSVLLLVYRSANPHITRLGRLPNTDVYLNEARIRDAVSPPGIEIIRMDAEAYFANAGKLSSRLSGILKEHAEAGQPLRGVVLDCSKMTAMDSTAATLLSSTLEEYNEAEVPLLFASMSHPVRDIFSRAGMQDRAHNHAVFLTVHDAVVELQSPRELLVGQLEACLCEERGGLRLRVAQEAGVFTGGPSLRFPVKQHCAEWLEALLCISPPVDILKNTIAHAHEEEKKAEGVEPTQLHAVAISELVLSPREYAAVGLQALEGLEQCSPLTFNVRLEREQPEREQPERDAYAGTLSIEVSPLTFHVFPAVLRLLSALFDDASPRWGSSAGGVADGGKGRDGLTFEFGKPLDVDDEAILRSEGTTSSEEDDECLFTVTVDSI